MHGDRRSVEENSQPSDRRNGGGVGVRSLTCNLAAGGLLLPVSPGETFKEVSLTSEAFSPKIALKSFSSGVIGLSPFGVTLPTRISPEVSIMPSQNPSCHLSSKVNFPFVFKTQ